MDDLDAESHQIREVFAQYGLAMYQAQCVERQLAILLATEYGPSPKTITRTQYDTLLKSHFSRTFGTIVKIVGEAISLPTDLEMRLDEALQHRNMLAHHYFWDRAAAFTSSDGRRTMLRELQSIVAFLEALDEDLTKITLAWAKRNGVTQQDYDRALQDILRSSNQET